jgi:hypothetical protein
MPEPSHRKEREFLPSANQALAELEAATGKPVLVMEEPELSAMETGQALDLAGQKQLLAEAAAVGQKGLAINDPQQMHQLRQYQGGAPISALQVACVYFVGVQLLLPGQDEGIDFGREYELAKGMVGQGNEP